MRRLTWFRVVVILAAVCLAAGSACADETIPSIWQVLGVGVTTDAPTETPQPTITPSPDAFRFREGIRWGMNPQQVKALESENMVERVLQDWAIMVTTEKVAVSRFTADLVFIFRQEQLKMIVYEFQRQDAENDFQYLTGALCSLYGEQKEADPSMVRVLMDAINPGRYQADGLTKAYGWLLSDGTAVFQYRYAKDSFGVMYVAPELGGGLYQTNGL
ncbi:MAG: hypothetical protein ABS897_06580 [Eubacteriales bacterium]